MPFTYTPNTPQASHFPANDQPLMNANNGYLQEFGTRDHQFTLLGAANSTDGTHKQVTLTNEAAPGFSGGSSVLFANAANGQSQLFFQNNTPATVQLTTVKTGVPTIAASPGCSFLPGGILIQWGTGASNVNVPFAVPFTTLYSVVVTPSSLAVSPAPAISVSGNSGFTSANSGAQVYNFRWIAIGLA